MHQDSTTKSEESIMETEVHRFLCQSEFLKLKEYCIDKENLNNVSHEFFCVYMLTFVFYVY